MAVRQTMAAMAVRATTQLRIGERRPEPVEPDAALRIAIETAPVRRTRPPLDRRQSVRYLFEIHGILLSVRTMQRATVPYTLGAGGRAEYAPDDLDAFAEASHAKSAQHRRMPRPAHPAPASVEA